MKKILRIFVVSIYIEIFLTPLLLAQSGNIIFYHIKSMTAHQVMQDSRGFMWFTSEGSGMLRYDGYTSRHYYHEPFDSTSLSANTTFTICEDKESNIWIGTKKGLNRYDRFRDQFITYYHNPQDTSSLNSDDIWRVYVDRSGRVWIGTQAGVDLYDQANYRFIHYRLESCYPESNISPAVLAIYEDRQGIFWIGTKQGGLLRLDLKTGTFKRYQHDPQNPNSLSYNTVSSIIEDSLGNLWIGTGFFTEDKGGGLNRFDKKSETFTAYRHDPANLYSLSENNITALYIDRYNNLWIGTYGGGLNRFDSPSEKFIHYKSDPQNPHGIGGNLVLDIDEDQSGDLWLALRDYGIDRFSVRSKISQHWPAQKIIPAASNEDMINTLIEDNNGNIWGGLGERGIFTFDPSSGLFKYYQHDQNNTNSFSGSVIMSLCTDRAGNIWIGTSGSGLNRFNPKSNVFTLFRYDPSNPNSLRDNLVHALCVDHAGTLWVGTAYGGLNKFNPETETFSAYLHDPNNPTSISDNHVFSIHEDQSGELWIGTLTGGLNRFDRLNQKFIRYQYNPVNPYSLLSNNVRKIYEDASGTLWFGSMEGGVSYLKKDERESGKFYHLTVKDGLPSFFITGFFEDNHNNLWITTNNGLCRYNLNDQKISNYFQADGLPSSNLQCAVKSSTDVVYIGGWGCLFCFNSDQWRINSHQPPIILTDFEVFNQLYPLDTTITEKKKIILSYKDNFFSIRFSALDYVDPGRNEYMYKMEGLHQDWIYGGTGRMATFTNLDPGHYIFRVKGSNNNGIWNEAGISLQIHIIPPWWRTNLAYIFYIVGIISLIGIMFHYQINRHKRNTERFLREEQERRRSDAAEHRAVVAELQAQTTEIQKEVEKEQMRSRIASDLHDDIGSNLSSITMISQMLEKKKRIGKDERQWLKDINKIARVTAESMRDIIWFINPENDDINKLLVKMRQTTNLMLENIDFTYTLPEKKPVIKTDINFRRNLFLIYKEILQNIIKHAKATSVSISIYNSNSILGLQVKDNGIGFDTGKRYQGNGLINLNNRARDIQGELTIESCVGSGTQVRLTVKNTVITV
jgi:ligand-binding sensor domain-containing protein/signal transduction histidine kinase